MRLLLLVAKPASRTFDPDRPRKTGSTCRYNDTPSCIGKPKGSVTMSQKVTVLSHCFLGYFLAKTALGVFLTPPTPLPGEGLTFRPIKFKLITCRRVDMSQGRPSPKHVATARLWSCCVRPTALESIASCYIHE